MPARNGWPLLLALAACAVPAPPSMAPAPPSAGFVTAADGLRLSYRIEGSGPDTVLVLHGGPGLSGESLRPDLAPLARGRALIFYDQRGSGLSDAVTGPTQVSLAHHVADLEAVRQRFGIERLSLVGHSWGGALAVRYALAHPDRVERLLLVDPMPPRRDPHMAAFGRNLRAWMDDETRAQVASAARALDDASDPVAACRAYWKLFIRGYLADPHGAVPVNGDPCFGNAATVDNEVYRHTMTPLGAYDWREAAGAVRVPVLIVHGARDPLPLAGAREWAAALPDARLLVVEGSGHFPHAENPAAFYPAVETFLAGSWPADAVGVSAPSSDRPFFTARRWRTRKPLPAGAGTHTLARPAVERALSASPPGEERPKP